MASALIKFIWTSGGTYHMANELPFLNVNKVTLTGLKGHNHELTSSENSVSPEASVTEDDHVSINFCITKLSNFSLLALLYSTGRQQSSERTSKVSQR